MAITLPRSIALLPLVAVVAGVMSLAHGAAPTTLPFESVRAGMKGIGRTVFQGERIEEFSVEIVGTIPHIGPEQDLILARCSGGPLAATPALFLTDVRRTMAAAS